MKRQIRFIVYKDNRHVFEVGFIINNRFLVNVKIFEPISERIYFICLRINGQNITIFICYAPSKEKYEKIKDMFMINFNNCIYNALP